MPHTNLLWSLGLPTVKVPCTSAMCSQLHTHCICTLQGPCNPVFSCYFWLWERAAACTMAVCLSVSTEFSWCTHACAASKCLLKIMRISIAQSSASLAFTHLSAGSFQQAHWLPPHRRPTLLLHQVRLRHHGSCSGSAVAGPDHELRLRGARPHDDHPPRSCVQRGGASHNANRPPVLLGDASGWEVPNGVRLHRKVPERWQGKSFVLPRSFSLAEASLD